MRFPARPQLEGQGVIYQSARIIGTASEPAAAGSWFERTVCKGSLPCRAHHQNAIPPLDENAVLLNGG
jgi:hypothetical protein